MLINLPIYLYAIEDITPPSIVEFSFSPDTVDVSTGDQAITVTARITDDLSGFSSGGFWFHSASGQPAGVQMSSSNRITGNAQDGIYQTSMVIPQLSENGVWHFTSAVINDQLSNQINFGEQDFIAMGFPTTFTVISTIDDTDGDGIPDDEDACPNSDLSETVIIDSWDTGVVNVLLVDGCTISDLIAECADEADSHGEFVSAVSHTTNTLKEEGIISGKDKGKIQKGAAKAAIP